MFRGDVSYVHVVTDLPVVWNEIKPKKDFHFTQTFCFIFNQRKTQRIPSL